MLPCRSQIFKSTVITFCQSHPYIKFKRQDLASHVDIPLFISVSHFQTETENSIPLFDTQPIVVYKILSR